ncbi:MAG: hypothetical protein GXY55_13490 [Phycisphaerae bacterium]|nr:hypothetical protein [Phycisphaerae bacterium]
MATPADFTVRARDEMYSIYTAYQSLRRRVDDLTDEVTAAGGAVGLYGADGTGFPEQGDGFDFGDMAAAFTNLTSLVGVPSTAQKQTIIRCRR